MLQAIDLHKRYGDHVALDRLNLTVQPGEICCLLGANGAGKTTTLHLFLDFVPRTSGQALIGGEDVAAHPLRTKALLAYIPEVVTLYPALTGLENLEYFARLAGTQLPTDALIAEANRTGLAEDALHQRLERYSKGMRQTLGIAIALVRQANFFISKKVFLECVLRRASNIMQRNHLIQISIDSDLSLEGKANKNGESKCTIQEGKKKDVKVGAEPIL